MKHERSDAAKARPAQPVRWDNLGNKHWNTMGRLAKVGHDKLLNGLVCVAPSTGTIVGQ